MPQSSTGSFNDADEYTASLADIFAELIVTSPGAFIASANRTTLQHLHLLQAKELLSRVAYVTLPPELVFISFSADPALPLVWRGIALEPGGIMFHARGERLHQRTDGPSCWGLISLLPASLAAFCETETGGALSLPEVGRILPLPRRDWKRLLHVHQQAGRLAETRPQIIGHPEVVRAMEHELAGLIVTCLSEGEVRPETELMRCAADVMTRFEIMLAKTMLAKSPGRSLTATELCEALGVSHRTLDDHCVRFLGVSAERYLQLRQAPSALDA